MILKQLTVYEAAGCHYIDVIHHENVIPLVPSFKLQSMLLSKNHFIGLYEASWIPFTYKTEIKTENSETSVD